MFHAKDYCLHTYGSTYILSCCCLFCRQIFLLHAINNWAKFMQATKPKRYTVNEKWDFVFIPPTILPTCLFLHDKRCKVAKYFQTHTGNTKIHSVQHWVNCFLKEHLVLPFNWGFTIALYNQDKDYCIDGLHTLVAKIGTMSVGGGNLGTQITPQGWIFWTMIFYNLKKFTSRSI